MSENINVLSAINEDLLYKFVESNGTHYIQSPINDTLLYNIEDFISLLQSNITEGYVYSPLNDTKLLYLVEDDNIYIKSPSSNNTLYIIESINKLLSTNRTYITSFDGYNLYELVIVNNDIRIYSPRSSRLLYIIENGLLLIGSHGNEDEPNNPGELFGRC